MKPSIPFPVQKSRERIPDQENGRKGNTEKRGWEVRSFFCSTLLLVGMHTYRKLRMQPEEATVNVRPRVLWSSNPPMGGIAVQTRQSSHLMRRKLQPGSLGSSMSGVDMRQSPGSREASEAARKH